MTILQPTEHEQEIKSHHPKCWFRLGYYSTMIFTTATILFSPPVFEQDVSFVARAETSATESVLVQLSPKQNAVSVVDEVWNLINKYYIDPTFHGQVRNNM